MKIRLAKVIIELPGSRITAEEAVVELEGPESGKIVIGGIPQPMDKGIIPELSPEEDNRPRCLFCHTKFDKTGNAQKYCSTACRLAAKEEVKVDPKEIDPHTGKIKSDFA